MSDDVYLSRKEAAALLGIHPTTLVTWTRTRGLPHRRISAKRVIFPRQALYAWIERQAGDPPAPAPPAPTTKAGGKILSIADR